MARVAGEADPGNRQLVATPELEFLVLGPMGVRRDRVDIHVGGVKPRTILAMLVSASGRPIGLEQIVDALYGEEVGDGARNSVYTYISAMRRQIGDGIHRTSGGYVLDVDPMCVDANRFETDVRSALACLDEDPETAGRLLRNALGLWRGYAYADVEGRGWFQPEITRLSELRLTALEGRIDADLALGRHSELLGEIEALTNEHPLRERFRAQHMLALYRAGRQTEALRSFARTRSFLADEVGVEPSTDLQELEQQILEHDGSLDLPVATELAQRAVVVVDIAPPEVLTHLPSSDRARLAHAIAVEFEQATARHGGIGFAQRGSTLYSALPSMQDAIDTIGELSSSPPTGIRSAIDFGEVEIQDDGEVSGPPLRRCAGMVAAGHPGQILLSLGAHQSLLHEDQRGWTVRSLGSHRIGGVNRPEQIFQLVFPGDDAEYPPLRGDAVPAPLPAERGSVAGYEIRQPVFSDLAGTTYRAYQPSVGREVMITAIDPVWANRPEFVSRFEVETQMVTRLQHPHIVPVLDYWRDPKGAYLVSPPIGRKLSDALEDDLLDETSKSRLLEDIGEALAYAHRSGVVHGSVSLSTVVVDESANAYLTGVGFAMQLSGAPLATSAFTSPESSEGEAHTIAADVFSLGVLIRVLAGSSNASVSGELHAVIERATARDPGARFSTVEELVDAFSKATGVTTTSRFTPARNPYKGLEAFGEIDADDFHGRTGAVRELLRRVSDHPLVAVVGPSGCGKSSLVEAGLIPAVRADSRTWVTSVMYPGTYPFAELESALARVAVEEPGMYGAALEEDEQALVQIVKRILPPKTTLLLVIDQFEELFTLTRDARTRDRFLNSLVALAADARSNVRVVITLRGDFFDRPLQHAAFGDLIEVGTFPLATPGRPQLADAIRLPAESAGVSWEPGLVEQIIDDVAGAPGTLPLLQYALTELFAARERDVLTLDDYHRVGGVLGALGSHADRVYAGLDGGQRETTRQVFLRLVALQPSGEQTRRRARLSDLNDIGEPAEIESILGAFGGVRLLTFDRDPMTRSPTVEVAHEALLTRWSRLAMWIKNAREDLLLHQRLADAVTEWEQSNRDDKFLLGRGRLEQFSSWAHGTDLTLSGNEAEYLRLSKQRADLERSRRRRVRNLVMSGFAIAAVVAIAFGVMALISRQEATANAELAHARELVASAFDVLDEDPELSLLLAVQAAGSAGQTVGSLSAVHESLDAHRKILTYTWPSDRELGIDLSTVISPDGRSLVASGGGTYVEAIDVDSGELLWDHEFGGEGITRATFTRDSEHVVVSYGWTDAADGHPPDETTRAALGVHVLDADTGETLRHLVVGKRCGVVSRVRALGTVQSETGDYLTAELGNDSNCNLTGDTRGGINPRDRQAPPPSLIDLETGETRRFHDSRLHPGGATALISSDGRYVARQRFALKPPYAGVIDVLDTDTGLLVAELDGYVTGISADGATVLSLDNENRFVWDMSADQSAGPAIAVPGGAQSRDTWLAPLGDLVAEVLDSGILLWDAKTGAEIERLFTGLGSNGQVSFSDDGSKIVVTEAGGRQAVVFDRTIPAELGSVDLCNPLIDMVSPIDAAGDVIAVQPECPSAITHFVVAAAMTEVREQFEAGGPRSVLTEDGSRLFFQATEQEIFAGPIRPLDTALGEVGDPLPGLCAHLDGSGNGCREFPNTPYPDLANDLEISADGRMLAMAGDISDGVTVWDLTTMEILATPRVEHLTRQPDRALSVGFSPNDDRLAVSFGWGSPELWLLSTDNWEPIAHFESEAQAPTEDLVFARNGGILIGTDDIQAGVGRIVFLDGNTLEEIHEIRDAHDGAISGLALSPDGDLLASSGLDGFVRIWDVSSHALVHEIPVSRGGGGVGGVDFVTDHHLAVVDTASGSLRILTIDTGELMALARSRVTRSFTATECMTYRIDPCPTLDDIREG